MERTCLKAIYFFPILPPPFLEENNVEIGDSISFSLEHYQFEDLGNRLKRAALKPEELEVVGTVDDSEAVLPAVIVPDLLTDQQAAVQLPCRVHNDRPYGERLGKLCKLLSGACQAPQIKD